jgi:SHS2 domain-containing protein
VHRVAVPYEFLEDVATADIAFRAWGKDPEELFRAAVDATTNVMIEDLDSIRPSIARDIRLDNETLDMLLFDTLQQIIYFKDAENLLLRLEEARIEQSRSGYALRAVALGETLNPARHRQRVDVKAVTLHRFEVKRSENGWEAFVILDI